MITQESAQHVQKDIKLLAMVLNATIVPRKFLIVKLALIRQHVKTVWKDIYILLLLLMDRIADSVTLLIVIIVKSKINVKLVAWMTKEILFYQIKWKINVLNVLLMIVPFVTFKTNVQNVLPQEIYQIWIKILVLNVQLMIVWDARFNRNALHVKILLKDLFKLLLLMQVSVSRVMSQVVNNVINLTFVNLVLRLIIKFTLHLKISNLVFFVIFLDVAYANNLINA